MMQLMNLIDVYSYCSNEEEVDTDSESVHYESGSEPSTAETAVSLDRLRHTLELSQAAIVAAFKSATNVSRERIGDKEQVKSFGEMIASLPWHETCHVGRLETLRQISSERESFF